MPRTQHTRLRGPLAHAYRLLLTVALATALAACGSTAPAAQSDAASRSAPAAAAAPVAAPSPASPDGRVHITLLHLNDVYEITPVGGGKYGGLARVATLLRRLEVENPHTYAVLAGDLFSPSALGLAKVEGKRLYGRQMVAVLNELGLDYATLGNHEFDIDQEAFQARIGESDFPYLSANVFDVQGARFPGTSASAIFEVPVVAMPASRRVRDERDADEEPPVRIGLIGTTITSNKADWVAYTEPLQALRDEAKRLAGKTDILIGLTHLSRDQDIELAETTPELDLILGGHEHENIQILRGPDLTPILKADANARTAWVHHLFWDPVARDLEVKSRIVVIDDSLPSDPEVEVVVNHWVDLGYAGFRADGFEPDEAIAEATEVLDGRESVVRNGTSRLTEVVGESILRAADADNPSGTPAVELAIYNAGSIRIDDELLPGKITQYDVLRVLPFGGNVLLAKIRGSLLQRVLDQGATSKGSGGFLQSFGVTASQAPAGTAGASAGAGDGEGCSCEASSTAYEIGGQPLDPERFYILGVNDYLGNNNQGGLKLFEVGADYQILATKEDVRNALIAELKRVYPLPATP